MRRLRRRKPPEDDTLLGRPLKIIEEGGKPGCGKYKAGLQVEKEGRQKEGQVSPAQHAGGGESIVRGCSKGSKTDWEVTYHRAQSIRRKT